jgi:Protein of unknown function (DUF4127)
MTKFIQKISVSICVYLWIIFFCFSANAQTKLTSKVLLIPLDDRPPCLQFPVKMGFIGDVEVVTPPRNLLGRFTEFGKSDEIIKWIKTQNLKSFDAAIVSLDMLSYGGLVAMREYETTESVALKRADFIRELRKSAPKMPIYGSSVIMRLAPTGNVVNESYRTNLAKWAEISVDETKKAETAELEKKIPTEALEKYKKARQRDLKLNLYAVELVRDKVIDYLILSQDDAKPNGVHIADREQLIEYVKSNNLGEKVAIQPGADEVSMLLLARTMTDKYKYRPKIKAIYSDEKIADQFMPYEDRPLRKTVSFHIKAVGAIEVTEEKDADILFYVFVSRFEKNGAEVFSETISNNFGEKSDFGVSFKRKFIPFIVADVDPKGEIQGADTLFMENLRKKYALRFASGYASWNTAGNTIGTALPQGILQANSSKLIKLKFAAEMKKAKSLKSVPKGAVKIGSTGSGPTRGPLDTTNWSEAQKLELRVSEAQTWFTLNRLLDDYFYHSIIRPQAVKYAKDQGWNVFRFDDEQTKKVEDLCASKIRIQVSQILNSFTANYENVDNFKFSLPWGRTFEAEIDFKLSRNGIFEQ